jgi:hypothetical protein
VPQRCSRPIGLLRAFAENEPIGRCLARKRKALPRLRMAGLHGRLLSDGKQMNVPKCSRLRHCFNERYLVDPASGHMLVSKIKPCMSKHEPNYGEAANSSLQQPLFT